MNRLDNIIKKILPLNLIAYIKSYDGSTDVTIHCIDTPIQYSDVNIDFPNIIPNIIINGKN